MTGPAVEIVLAEAVAIRPGDRVLVCLRSDDVTEEDAAEAREKLQDRFPGSVFTFVTGVQAVAVMRGDHG